MSLNLKLGLGTFLSKKKHHTFFIHRHESIEQNSINGRGEGIICLLFKFILHSIQYKNSGESIGT